MAKKHSNKMVNTMLQRFDEGQSATQIAKDLGLYTTSVTRVLKRNGRKMRKCVGKNHPSWKGGRVVKNGYPMKYMPDHERRYNIPYVPMHVLVMEKKLGRTPKKSEPIHHIDLDRKNYDEDNLYLCSGHKEHQKVHKSLDKVVSKLIKNGTIKFDNGEYSV